MLDVKQEYIPQKQYVVLPRHRPSNNSTNRPVIRKRKLESSVKNTMKVVIPSHSNQKNQGPKSIKKEYLASTIKPENTFAIMCENTLNEIYEQSTHLKSIDTYVDTLIEYGVARSINSKITLRRSNTTSPSAPLDIDENTAGAGSKRFEDVIERQRAEIDDLRTRLIERKRLEDTWKETVNTLLHAVKHTFKQHKQKLAVANAKCKLIDLAKREKTQQTVINPTGQCAQQLAQWAAEITQAKKAKQLREQKSNQQQQQFFMLDKKQPSQADNQKQKRLVLLRKNQVSQSPNQIKTKSRPIIMMRKKTQVKKEPIFNEEPMAKVPRVINQPCAGSMSPDSGCDSSDGNVSSPGDPQQPPASTPATPKSNQLDMSTMIEQAFAHSVGQIPPSQAEQNEAPISPHSSSDLGSTDLDLFDQLDLSTELNQCAPPWEELDIDIEPSFTSITPFLNL